MITAQSNPFARRLVLGTAQFGMDYGATNAAGQVTQNEAAAIVALATKAGVEVIDTAAGYGTSETVLGEILPGFSLLRVITKIPEIGGASISATDIAQARQTLLQSLARLRRDTLDAVLLHHGADILKPGGAQAVGLLQSLKRDGVAARIGVSVYDANDIDSILHVFTPDIVQLPVNLLDQRLIGSGHIARLKSKGVEIHARSIFLQGVLLAEPAKRPAHFQRFKEQFGPYDTFLSHSSLSRMQACLGFMAQHSGADRIVVGVTSAAELSEIIAAGDMVPAIPPMRDLACDDPTVVDPRRWTLPPRTKASAR